MTFGFKFGAPSRSGGTSTLHDVLNNLLKNSPEPLERQSLRSQQHSQGDEVETLWESKDPDTGQTEVWLTEPRGWDRDEATQEPQVCWEDLERVHGTAIRKFWCITAGGHEIDDVIDDTYNIFDIDREPVEASISIDAPEDYREIEEIRDSYTQDAGVCIASSWLGIVGYTPTREDLMELESYATDTDPQTGRAQLPEYVAWQAIVSIPERLEEFEACNLMEALKKAAYMAENIYPSGHAWSVLDRVKRTRRTPWWFSLTPADRTVRMANMRTRRERIGDLVETKTEYDPVTKTKRFEYNLWVPGLLAQLLFMVPEPVRFQNGIPGTDDWDSFMRWVHNEVHTPHVIHTAPGARYREYRDVFPRIKYGTFVQAIELAAQECYRKDTLDVEGTALARMLVDDASLLDHLESLGEAANEKARMAATMWVSDPGNSREHAVARSKAHEEYKDACMMFVATFSEWATQLLCLMFDSNLEVISWEVPYLGARPIERPRRVVASDANIEILRRIKESRETSRQASSYNSSYNSEDDYDDDFLR